jgi:phage-related protein
MARCKADVRRQGNLQIDRDIWVIHAGQKKSKSGIKTPRQDMTLCRSGHGDGGRR